MIAWAAMSTAPTRRRPRVPTAARLRAAALAVALTVVACAGDGDTDRAASDRTTSEPPPATTTTTVPGAPGLASAAIKVTKIVQLTEPVSLATRPGDDALYVALRAGTVQVIRDGKAAATPFLDLTKEVSLNGERGLLGIAFSTKGDKLYASFTDKTGANRLVEYQVSRTALDPSTARNLLSVDHPHTAHHAGHVTLGPDGLLYLSIGDGEDRGLPRGNAQRLDTLLGKILRIDPKPDGTQPYTVPTENPFVDRAGARQEIFAFGLRNPWRFSFDRATGDLWIGDVGQYAVEEVSFAAAGAAAGANFGWPFLEGNRKQRGTAPADAIAPLKVYPHADGRCAIVGGYVYRGRRIPALTGAYVYADLCEGKLRAIAQVDGKVAGDRELGVTVKQAVSFGEDVHGELYLLSLTEGVFSIDPVADS